MKLGLFQWIFIFGFFPLWMQASESIQAKNAQRAFSQKNYSEAIKNWNLELKNPDANLGLAYYNIANCLMEEKDYAQAILFYERALKQNYNLQNANYNLKIAQARLNLEPTQEDLPFLTSVKKFIYMIPLSSLKWILVICAWLIFGLYILQYFKPTEYVPSVRNGLWILFGVFAFLYVFQSRYVDSQSDAIIMRDIPLISKNKKEDASSIPKGSKVKVLDRVEDKYQIETENDSTYWVDKTQIQTI